MHEQNNTNGQGEAQHFTEAVTIANIPTLLMVLVQRIVVNSPYRNATFYDMTRAADLGDFIVEPRHS